MLAGSESTAAQSWVDSLYGKLHLDSLGLERKVFFYACKGYEYLLSTGQIAKPETLTICDYSQSSKSRRLYVIDMQNGQMLFNTFVSHGKNSGKEFANTFSNLTNSHKSSLGFMITAETYLGKAGYSMRLDGMEKGINSNVRKRDIVMHGSWYVNETRADEGQNMGRSYGCPAVPYAEHSDIIDKIKEGSCFFAYYPDAWYANNSQILKAKFTWPALAAMQQGPVAATTSASFTNGTN
ncbi:MAG: murein L,D-transpeptidase catalytic domain family protein [Filimonas sp.]|nr:murein L,D-transpeptidase catalytic domain family protein [Filimonas sp.]